MKHTIPPAPAGRPFIKWLGVKRQLIPAIEGALPEDFDRCHTCVEPFAGGGAVFFHLRQKYPGKCYVLNDCNVDLIDAYRTVRDRPHELITILRKIKREYMALPSREARKAYFLRRRERYNGDGPDMVQRTALFIFLNKTCYNGLYRVNGRGEYNAPFGDCSRHSFFDEAVILQDSRLLQGVELTSGDYARCAEYAASGAFFYLDPPYRPLNATSSFTSYTKNGFGDGEQVRLRDFCCGLTARGARWMQSNSDGRAATPPNDFLDDLYRDCCISRVVASRHINRGGKNNRTADHRVSAAVN